MRLTSRSYPHPVLGNKDDFPKSEFQVRTDVRTDRNKVYINVEIACSSDSISSLIGAGKASYALHIECTSTLYRNCWRFSANKYCIEIPSIELANKVEISIFSIIDIPIKSYSFTDSHSDYNNVLFDLQEGDIIAISESYEALIENKDYLSKMSSIMEVVESKHAQRGPLTVEYNSNKIQLILSKQDFSQYKRLKSNVYACGLLSSILVLPVLVNALNLIKSSSGEFNGLRWSDNVIHRLAEFKISGDFDALDTAQKLLETPVARTLSYTTSLLKEMEE
ncbi:MAG: hypothetical protein H7A37_07045 [Chlamydiales bacterium]|nr:hypothetical protein [Chlamydiales bacterium]